MARREYGKVVEWNKIKGMGLFEVNEQVNGTVFNNVTHHVR